jgi:diaminohydroxyphosphoribosylaminopyrimidine deaminase / 5-amino-6-(5-phosphoribosylamino)uracil reductase
LSGGSHDQFMTQALELAWQQLGRTWPNPSVGCVIVDPSGAVLAQAATADGGRPHAEEIVLASAGPLARGATVYVSLEPCGSRSGGGVACSQLLIAAGVGQVVIAVRDPHPHGAGGIDALRAAGVLVIEDVLAEEAIDLNAGFFHRLKTGRPLAFIDDDPSGYDQALTLHAGEDVLTGLERLGALGLTRVFARPGTPEAFALINARLVPGSAPAG